MGTKTTIICDRCGRECVPADHEVGLRLTGKRWGDGPSGGHINGADVEYDFCPRCTGLFNEWLGERGVKDR